MTSGVLCCYHGTLMAALEALSVAVAIGAFVPWHPPQSQSTGTNIYFGLTPKVKAGPLDPLGPQFEVDSLSDFRASRDGSGPSGQIRAPQDKPGPNRTNQGPAERIRASLGQPEPRGANQGPAGRVRTPGRIGSRGMSQGPAEKINELGQIRAPQDVSVPYIQDQPGLRRTNKGPRGTNQDPAIRIRVIWDGSGPAGPNKTPEWIGPRGTYQCPKWTSQGPAGRIMGPMGKPRPRRTNQGPVGRIRPSETSLGPTGRIRTPGRIEPRGMSQGPQNNSEPVGHYQALVDGPEPC